MSHRVAMLAEEPGWHGDQLLAEFQARQCSPRVFSVRDCAIDVERGVKGLVLPGFEERLPDGVFVRSIPGGTLEQIVLDLNILHVLKGANVPVYNSGRSIELSVDKGMATLLLSQAGLPVPATWVCSATEYAQRVWDSERAQGHRLVVKPLFGSQGKGLLRLSAPDELPPVEEYGGVYYLQRYIEGQQFDWRVFVINHRAVATMRRYGTSWINNVAQGATHVAAPREPQVESLAQAAAKLLGMDYAGVDLMRDSNGNLQILELNSIPAWRGLQEATGSNIASYLAEDFCFRHVFRNTLLAV